MASSRNARLIRNRNRQSQRAAQAAIACAPPLPESLESRLMFTTVPSPFVSADIGTVGTPGTASYNAVSKTFTVQGAGSDLFGAQDDFHFVYEPLTGDGTIIARVASVAANDPTAPAGLDIRGSTAATAADAFIGVRGDGQVAFNARTDDGTSAGNVSVVTAPAPIYLELQRTGNDIAASTSTDGVTFTPVGTITLNTLPATALVGLAVASSDLTMLSTMTADHLSITDTIAPTGHVTAAPPLTVAQVTPYQFTVTYDDNTAVKASTLGAGSLTVSGPSYSQPATLLSVGLTDGPEVVATYGVPAPVANGTYTINAVAGKVTDTSNNPLPAGSLGTFQVNIPGDVIHPTATLTNPPTLVAPGAPYTFSVTYSDNVAVSGASLGNSNLVVSGPNGFNQPATLVSTGLIDNATIVATYRVPALSTSGTYTVTMQGNQVRDTSGNAVASGAVGTVVVNISLSNAKISGTVTTLDGTGVAGQTVFIDANHDGKLNNGEQSTTTDASGNYQFVSLPAGTYRVAVLPTATETLLEPAAGFHDIALTDGQTAAGTTFAEVKKALPAATAGPDLTATVLSTLPVSVVGGTKGKIKVKITNSGTLTAAGPVNITLSTSTDGTLSGVVAVDTTVSAGKLKLKPGASKVVTIKFTYPAGLPDGSYKLLASVDSSNAIAETNESNNTAVSSAVTIAKPFVDLTGAFSKVPAKLTRGTTATLPIVIKNLGNSPATGLTTVSYFESTDQTLDVGDTLLGKVTHKINIAANGHTTFSARLPIPAGAVAGSEYIIAVVNSTNTIVESNSNNNTAVSPTKVTFA